MNEDMLHYSATFVAGALAGAINSVAGGGTLVTFSTLTWMGVNEKIASASSGVGLCFGFLAGAWGFRNHKPPPGKLLLSFSLVCLAGGYVGALLMERISLEGFKKIVPWLILLAALLFLFQEHLTKRFFHNATSPSSPSPSSSETYSQGLSLKALLSIFVIGVYGGFFGAGLGIMLLTALGLFNLGDIFRLNYLKNGGSLLINLAASILFIVKGMIDWPVAICIALGGCVGALAMSGLARRLGAKILRKIVSGIGIAIAATMLIRQFL